jgi:hypothetical protein
MSSRQHSAVSHAKRPNHPSQLSALHSHRSAKIRAPCVMRDLGALVVLPSTGIRRSAIGNQSSPVRHGPLSALLSPLFRPPASIHSYTRPFSAEKLAVRVYRPPDTLTRRYTRSRRCGRSPTEPHRTSALARAQCSPVHPRSSSPHPLIPPPSPLHSPPPPATMPIAQPAPDTPRSEHSAPCRLSAHSPRRWLSPPRSPASHSPSPRPSPRPP